MAKIADFRVVGSSEVLATFCTGFTISCSLAGCSRAATSSLPYTASASRTRYRPPRQGVYSPPVDRRIIHETSSDRIGAAGDHWCCLCRYRLCSLSSLPMVDGGKARLKAGPFHLPQSKEPTPIIALSSAFSGYLGACLFARRHHIRRRAVPLTKKCRGYRGA